ncbi:NAD(P)(+)--arginine ADP-ribosyltransferase 2-like [Vipera latastei]
MRMEAETQEGGLQELGVTMKIPTVWTVQVLCLIGFFTGPLQVLCLQKIPLDMSRNCVDDQYIGCHHKKEFKVQKPGYVPIPLKYMSIWNLARGYWAKLGSSVGKINPIYGTAVVAYTIGWGLDRDFNNAVRNAGKSKYSYNQFAFKDFFFLLTKFVQARKIADKCYEVFRGINGIRFDVHSKQRVRFGQFASSSLVKEKAQNFGQDTFFSIKTCHGVPIYDLSYYPHEMEVLIPPYETFIVTYHKTTLKGVTIRLKSHGVYSRFNCEALKAKAWLPNAFSFAFGATPLHTSVLLSSLAVRFRASWISPICASSLSSTAVSQPERE